MKRSRAKILSVVLLAATAFLGTVSAQPPRDGDRGPARMHGRFGGPGPGGGPGEMSIPPARVLQNIAGLTDEQIAELEDLKGELQATVEPLRTEGRGLREAIGVELNSEAPDATAVGEMVISEHQIREQIREARENFRSAFEALLTEEQLQALADFRERRSGRKGRFHRDGFETPGP